MVIRNDIIKGPHIVQSAYLPHRDHVGPKAKTRGEAGETAAEQEADGTDAGHTAPHSGQRGAVFLQCRVHRPEKREVSP